jgi:uncharacterized protein
LFFLQMANATATGQRNGHVDAAQYEAMRSEIEAAVQAHMGSNDPSHDFAHVLRVRHLALVLAQDVSVPVNLQVVELGALLHDARDHKYTTTSGDMDVRQLLGRLSCPWTNEICELIEQVGFAAHLADPDRVVSIECDIVGDADRLDALGAIGVARCFSFGAARNRPMVSAATDTFACAAPNAADYVVGNRGSTVGHFYDKLLLLRGLMRTDAGKRLADARHAFLEVFLRQFWREMDDAGAHCAPIM